MLIQKGGITRQIDEKNLQRYKDKGYVVVEQSKQPVEPEPIEPVQDPKAPKK